MTAKQWLKSLIAAFVTGFSSSGLSVLGISGAQAVGIKITQLDAKQFMAASLFGGIIGLLAYLKQSPVPPDDGPVSTIKNL